MAVFDLARLPCPKPCLECADAKHHWVDAYYEDFDGAAQDAHLACKHCDAKASQCASCEEPILRVLDDSGICQECQDEEAINADTDPAELQAGPEPEPEGE